MEYQQRALGSLPKAGISAPGPRVAVIYVELRAHAEGARTRLHESGVS
jgi:hypothetical protein